MGTIQIWERDLNPSPSQWKHVLHNTMCDTHWKVPVDSESESESESESGYLPLLSLLALNIFSADNCEVLCLRILTMLTVLFPLIVTSAMTSLVAT